MVINTAAKLEGITCSAFVTPPFPPSNSNPPMIAAAFQLARVGRGAPLKRIQVYSTPPAIRKRTAAIRNGGNVSTAKRIAR